MCICSLRAAVAVALTLASVAAGSADLTVSAATSLSNAFKDIGPLYEAANPGSRLMFNFGASGALLQQMVRGAPVDVFVSADPESMDQAQGQGLLKTRRNLVSNALVVIVPAAAPAAPQALSDLSRAGFARIAISQPSSSPAGRYARSALESARLWSAVEPRLIGANTVRQVLDYVARAEVDAGFVFATDAALLPEKVKVAFTVPTARPVIYPIAVLAQASNPADAARFVDFLSTAPAQAVLARYGFGRP